MNRVPHEFPLEAALTEALGSGRTVSLVIGHPLTRTLSPALHSAGYDAQGISGEYTFFACKVEPHALGDFLQTARAVGARGISVTMPHKQTIIPFLDDLDPLASRIGAVNTVVNTNGRLVGYNTDAFGVVRPLSEKRDLRNATVLLLGAGGAARAAAHALSNEGARVVIANRDEARARALAGEIRGECVSWGELRDVSPFDIVVQATSVGSAPDVHLSPIEAVGFGPGMILLEMVYTPAVTRLMEIARDAGATLIPGIEMLLWQGVRQYELYTQASAPVDAMRRALESAVGQQS